MNWILDMGLLYVKNNTYFKQIDFYWQTKSIVEQVIGEEQGAWQKAILDKL